MYDDEKFLGLYRIQSARLKNFDYGSSGAYFVTICTKYMTHYFGEIQNGIMGLNVLGLEVWRCWRDIPNYFPFVVLDVFVVMPNHVHGVLFIDKNRNQVETRLIASVTSGGGVTTKNNPMGKNTLGEIVRYFKGKVSFEIRKKSNPQFQWQPRYHDHVIRNENHLNKIRLYIKENPKQ